MVVVVIATSGLIASVVTRRGDIDIDVSLAVAPGEVLAVLGTNGSGKTGLILALAGLVPIESGQISYDDRVLDDVAQGIHVTSADRNVGYLPQHAMLFPHLSVLENVAFGPRSRGVSALDARRDATSMLSAAGLTALIDRPAATLSGGEAQRIALLRALAFTPDLLLLDEPTSALDVAARTSVRADLVHRINDFSGATVLVTHDAVEALTLASRVLILDGGKVVQEGDVAEVVRRPRTAFVARLAGLTVLSGTAREHRVDLDAGGALIVGESSHGRVLVTVSPRGVTLHRLRPEGSARNVWPVRVSSIEAVGDLLRVSLDGEPSVAADVTMSAVAELGARPGVELWASIKATELDVYPA